MKAIDLFAGWGGMTLGAHQAGANVLWAANHWPLAVEAHAANHPETEHVCQDLRQADWTALPEYDLLLAAPACQGHSTASQPKRRLYHDALRATAWAVVDCAEVTRPRALLVENVPSFLRWQLFPLWKQALETLGYHVEAHVESASHHGVPQRRSRMLLTGTLSGRRVDMTASRSSEVPFGPCIAWDEGVWRPWREATPSVQLRIERSRKRLGERFLTQHTSDHMGTPLDEPIRTITTQDQWAVVNGDYYRPLTIRENALGMGFPEDYRIPEQATRRDVIVGFGNAIPPGLARDGINAVMMAA